MKSLATRLLEQGPPWLQRARATKILGGVGDYLDARAAVLSEAVRARFPRAVDQDALAYIGRERRIRRAPTEAAATYATRLLRWWDAHRARGSAFEMLRQLRDFFVGIRIDIVNAAGTRRHWVSTSGVVTRDSVTWTPAPLGEWAHIWVFLYLAAAPTVSSTLITHAGDTLITHLGDDLIAITNLGAGGALAEEEAELYRAVPREWSAAHIPYVTVVLLYGVGELWDYPPPGTWDESGSITWDQDTPVVLIAD